MFRIQSQDEGGGDWHVQVDSGKIVALHQGKSPKPTFYFTMDLTTFRKIHQGELNALTAMGKAKASVIDAILVCAHKGYYLLADQKSLRYE